MAELDLTTTKFLEAAAKAREESGGGNDDPDYSPIDMSPKKKMKWTKGLTAICILFLLIGTTGAFSGLLNATYLFVGTAPLEAVKYDGGSRAEHKAKVQAQKIAEEQRLARQKYFWVLLYMEGLKIAIATGFILSAFFMFQRDGRGRVWGAYACGFAIFFHFSILIVGLLVLGESYGTLHNIIDSAFNESAAEARTHSHVSDEEVEAAKQTALSAIQMGMFIGMSVILIVKAVFYTMIILYLNKPEIKKIFGVNVMKEYQQQLESKSAPAAS